MIIDQNFARNVQKSFDLAKKDVYKLYEHFNCMKSEMEELRKNNSQMMLAIARSKAAAVPVNKQYVASQQGRKVHQANCLKRKT